MNTINITTKNKYKEQHRELIDQEMKKFIEKGGKIQKLLKSRKYKEYMESEDWLKTMRHKAFSLLGSECEICGSREEIQIHHNNYNRVGVESPLRDLAVLCRKCHSKFHEHVPLNELRRQKKGSCFLCSLSSKKNSDYFTKYRTQGKICERCLDLFIKDIKSLSFKVKDTTSPKALDITAIYEPKQIHQVKQIIKSIQVKLRRCKGVLEDTEVNYEYKEATASIRRILRFLNKKEFKP